MESAKKQPDGPSGSDKWPDFLKKALPYEQAIKLEPLKTLIDAVISYAQKRVITEVMETGFGTGYAAVKIADELGIAVVGIEASQELIDRADALSAEKGGILVSLDGDVFDSEVYGYDQGRPWLIYHQGLLEHFSDYQIQKLLRLQVENSRAVIFSVPSVFYGRQDFGDERLLSLEQWQEILIPFDLLKLEYYDEKRHILGILKGDFYAG